MVLNANVILLMAAVILALFAVVQLPKLFALLKGQKKDEMVVLAEPVKTVVVYQSEKTPKKAFLARSLDMLHAKVSSSRHWLMSVQLWKSTF